MFALYVISYDLAGWEILPQGVAVICFQFPELSNLNPTLQSCMPTLKVNLATPCNFELTLEMLTFEVAINFEKVQPNFSKLVLTFRVNLTTLSKVGLESAQTLNFQCWKQLFKVGINFES